MVGKAPKIPLPKQWSKHVKSGILHVISLAQMALIAARGLAARKDGLDVQAELLEARREISLLEEELRIKDLRLARIKPRGRPHYRATERLSILELRAARGWSAAETAARFLLRPVTISSWMARVDECGERALIETSVPVNRFPDFVRYMVRRLKVLCPSMGKKRIAQTLARAGLKLGVTTVGRILNERDDKQPSGNGVVEAPPEENAEGSPVRAQRPDHVWQVADAGPDSRGLLDGVEPVLVVAAVAVLVGWRVLSISTPGG